MELTIKQIANGYLVQAKHLQDPEFFATIKEAVQAADKMLMDNEKQIEESRKIFEESILSMSAQLVEESKI